VGYGSPLRGDDAVGRVVAEEIERLALPGVEVRVLTQLVPEVVEAMEGRDRVVFVDATVDADQVGVARVEHRRSNTSSHHADPSSLLALMADIGMQAPEAHLVSVPAADTTLGEALSPVTQRAVSGAVAAVRRLIGETT
jgi:hydrogenase maturation protease